MPYQQTVKEELWNTLTHGLGVILSLAGILTIVLNVNLKDSGAWLGISLYAFSLLLLYSASTCYHGVNDPKLKHKLRILDHISIYVLIAGTYSPIVLTVLKQSHGAMLFYLVWGITAFGIILKLFFTGRFEKFSLILYLIMGWLIAIDAVNLVNNLSSSALLMLILGGFFYTIGIYFYVKSYIPYNHVIWHIFVLLGSASHYLMIYFTVT